MSALLRLWRWFLAGFLVVFAGILLLPMHRYDASTQAVVECKLWQYYLLALRQTLFWHGLTSGGEGAGTIALQHVTLSAGGGTLMLAVRALIGWGVHKGAGRT
jgi:hypothetical protein